MRNWSTTTRSFRAADCNGLTTQCTQRLIVTYEQGFSVKMPDDILVYDCDTTVYMVRNPRCMARAAN